MTEFVSVWNGRDLLSPLDAPPEQRAEPKCSKCNRVRDDERYRYCNRCRRLARKYGRRWREEHRGPEICCRCGKHPQSNGYKYCPTCRENDRARRRKRSGSGLCQRCQMSLAARGRTKCRPCLIRGAELSRQLRERRRADGLCSCGKRPPAPARKQCLECLTLKRHKRIDTLDF